MKILGISAFYHDSAAALVIDGQIVAAAQEERFSRIKHDASLPLKAVDYCLAQAGIKLGDVDYVAFYDKPFLKFERLLETYLAFAPRGFNSFRMSLPIWLKDKLFQKSHLEKEFRKLAPEVNWRDKLLFAEHHLSHAASAYYPSPFADSIVLTMDGVGEWATTSTGIGQGANLNINREIHFPHSLGLLYSAFTYYTGFKVNSGEYKVMGLAPYGEPKYAQLILDKIVDLKEDGSFRLDMQYFDYCTGMTMTNEKFDALFGIPVRQAEDDLTQVHMDLATSIQAVTEEVILKMTRSLAKESSLRNLCLAGGVALNCVANGKIQRDGAFENIWVQPAAGDAGGALGAALATHYGFLGQERPAPATGDAMAGSYLGPAFGTAEIERRLSAAGAVFHTLDDNQLYKTAATALANENAVGWFQGRMEFGPRALGNRSILGDPRSPAMQSMLNLKVKYRESFRPFAPSVLRDHATDWFDHEFDSPYMLMVADVKEEHRLEMTDAENALFGIEKLNVPRSTIPAVTHVDYSARIQTVNPETNSAYHRLISEFNDQTGCPIVINTSFNVRGEPIVCTPQDAFRCFMGTEIEVLAVGNCWLIKDEQDPALRLDYKSAFKLD